VQFADTGVSSVLLIGKNNNNVHCLFVWARGGSAGARASKANIFLIPLGCPVRKNKKCVTGL